MNGPRKLLFVVAEGRYFVSHRLHLAREAIAQGFCVAVLCRDGGYRTQIEATGAVLFDWRLNRGSLNFWYEMRAFWDLLVTIRQFRPCLVHAVAMKPVIYVGVASLLTRSIAITYSLGGLGFVFSSNKPLARFLRPVLSFLFRQLLSRKRIRLILQNPDDRELLLRANVVSPTVIQVIRGAGVDTTVFSPKPMLMGHPLVVLPARLLWDKGVGEFVAVARLLREEGVVARFVLLGEPDSHNPECIPQAQVDEWVAEGQVEAWGNRNDMPDVLNQASIVCLPSSREGLPKALLEAASCGKPIVTFDVPGCREVVVHGVNGFLVPFRNTVALAEALRNLLSNPELCRRMGVAGRDKVLREFSQEQVAEETARVWREVLV